MFADVAYFYGAVSGGGKSGRHCLRCHTHVGCKKNKPRPFHPHHAKDLGSKIPSHVELVVFTTGYCVKKKIPTCRFFKNFFFSPQKENRVNLNMLYHPYR